MANTKIKEAAKKNGVYFWEIAHHMGISEPTITRKMRFELSEREANDMLAVITEIAKEKTAV